MGLRWSTVKNLPLWECISWKLSTFSRNQPYCVWNVVGWQKGKIFSLMLILGKLFIHKCNQCMKTKLYFSVFKHLCNNVLSAIVNRPANLLGWYETNFLEDEWKDPSLFIPNCIGVLCLFIWHLWMPYFLFNKKILPSHSIHSSTICSAIWNRLLVYTQMPYIL